MSTPDLVIRRVHVRGRVQGVGFRAWVEHEALRRGLEGWARNRRDGSVEAVFAGDDAVVRAMVAACHEGPTMSRVETVEEAAANLDALAARRQGDRFSILPTV